MIIWGRVAGVLLGGILWGYPGVMIGFLLGYFFDKGLEQNIIPEVRAKAMQTAFFEATFTVLGHIAKADGRVSEEEIKTTEKIMTDLHLTSEQRQYAITCFNKGKQSDFDLKVALNILYLECGRQKNLLRFFIEIQVSLAMAEGTIKPETKELLIFICKTLSFSPDDFDFLYRAEAATHYTRDPLAAAYQMLGVTPDTSPKDIKKAYRKLMSQHHPDKLAAKGLPKEMMKLAKEKTQKITASYEMVCRARGFR